jgi:hypothetical protein
MMAPRALALLLVLCAAAVSCCVAAEEAPPRVHPFHNGGTPGGIPPKTDCNLREFVWEAGKKLMPRRGSFKTLFDSMQLGACGVEGPSELDAWHPPAGAPPTGKAFYVDATQGSDSAAGTKAAPLKTIGAAIGKATEALAVSDAQPAKATIVLRSGVYHGCDGKGNVCALGPAQSGLTIVNEGGEDATVTGGEPLAIAASDWKRVPPKVPGGGTQWTDMKGTNDVADRAGSPTPSSDTKCCKFLGVMKTDTLDACKAAAVSAGGNFAGVTYHTAAFAGVYSRHCYGVHDGDCEQSTCLPCRCLCLSRPAFSAVVRLPIHVQLVGACRDQTRLPEWYRFLI